MRKFLLLPIVASLSAPVLALPKMHEPGFHGLVNIGVMGGEMETNFIASIDNFNLDLSDQVINDLGSPEAEDFVSFMGSFDFGWTFSSGKTRVSMGNDFTDLLQFDRSLRISLRHDFDTLGQVRLDALQPVAFETQLYRDPYLVGEKRPDTDEEVSGGRLVWDRIFNSGFGFQATMKTRDIDNEESGQSIASLTPEERGLLDREGDVLYVELSYEYRVDNWHSVKPAVNYIDRDLDGGAMAQDGFSIGMDHFYIGEDIDWANKLVYTELDGDKVNPIFNDTNDADGWAATSVIVFKGDFLGKWSPNVQLTYAEINSEIDFNDSTIWMLSAGVARKF